MSVLGVAVAVPRPFADELEGWRERFGDPAAHAIQAHVTLLPPTTVAQVGAVEEHLSRVADRHAAFAVRLQGTGTFRPMSPVVYVRVVEGQQGLSVLEQDVRSGVLDRRLEFPYHPHVTVAHRVSDDVLVVAERTLADYEAAFTADAFTLYEMADGGVWHPVRDFHLRMD